MPRKLKSKFQFGRLPNDYDGPRGHFQHGDMNYYVWSSDELMKHAKDSGYSEDMLQDLMFSLLLMKPKPLPFFPASKG
jgi:hypothetical protein